MDHISWLSDVYGPRLTGGPGHSASQRLGVEEVQGMGAGQRAPRNVAVWKGLVARQVQRAHDRAAGAAAHRLSRLVDARNEGDRSPPMSSEFRSTGRDFEKYRGKLAGKIVLTQPERECQCSKGLSSIEWVKRILPRRRRRRSREAAAGERDAVAVRTRRPVTRGEAAVLPSRLRTRPSRS